MAQPEIEELFDNSRWPSGFKYCAALLYFPFGFLLVLIRVFLGIQTYFAFCILPKLFFFRSFVLRVMCFILGVMVTVDDKSRSKRDKCAKVMVANYTSSLDHLAVDLIQQSIFPCVWDLPYGLIWLLGYSDMGAKAGKDVLIKNAKIHCRDSQVPMLVFPEGASTNGKRGLLKFSTWPFSLEETIQPVILQVRRPCFAEISPSIIESSWWRDLFWSIFVPMTYYTIRFLPPVNKNKDETVELFAKRVQLLMADELGLQATTHTTLDKVEYMKRRLTSASYSDKSNETSTSDKGIISSAAPTANDAMKLMINQVQDVFPHIPARLIQQDLVLTKDVDLTITNILEGKAVSNQEESGDQPSTSEIVNDSPSLTASTAAPSFSRSSQQRHQSLAERKQALLEYARQRYIEKHAT